ncbi:MAG: methylenetetrahydrofolate reductase C-terminal domain-containing protein [Planctomycetota bacterium]|jgi:ferredoxin
MIVAERKPYEEIKAMLEGRKRILVAGCGTCVAVCNTGGEKEVGVLAEELRITSKMEDLGWEISEVTAQRQCEAEFLEPLKGAVEGADAVLSLACGAGIQLLAAQYTAVPVFPAVNTTFLGTNIAPGVWTEYCHGCGNCVLGETGGICPVARCSKSLVNGACGGTDKGMCEVDPKTIDCGWFLGRRAAAVEPGGDDEGGRRGRRRGIAKRRESRTVTFHPSKEANREQLFRISRSGEVHHHGGDRPAQGHEHPAGDPRGGGVPEE